MTLDKETRSFFSEPINQAQNPKHAVEYCREKRQTASPFLKILVTSLLWIFFEIKDYLDDFETSADRFSLPLEKVETERKKIQQLVLTPFVDNLVKQSDLNSQDEILHTIKNLILSWDDCPKQVLPDKVF